MFDRFNIVDNPFGIPYPKGAGDYYEYQTKDFECKLSVYRFNQDGKIIGVQLGNRSTTFEGIEYTGELEIYTSIRENDVGITWIEYKLMVENGQVISVTPCFNVLVEDVQIAFDTEIPYKVVADEEKDDSVLLEGGAFPDHVALPPIPKDTDVIAKSGDT